MSLNDQNKVIDYIRQNGSEKSFTTVLPNTWVFNKQGTTMLKRKRKHKTSVSKEDKDIEWVNFCLGFWGVKLNRETKLRMIKELRTTSKHHIEEKIKLKRSDDQK